MSNNNLNKFYISIVLPSVLAILLFIISLYVVILPSYEKAVMEKKKEMIAELTNTAWSLLEEYENEYQQSNLSLEDAQRIATERVAKIRYGDELKDYFWIIDKQPKMIIHPYRPELNNSDLSQYKDPNGKKLFVEASRLIEKQESGFIDYMWQWKDDSTHIVPKLSYVKEFAPWGWIIGTGIYIDDVELEISNMKGRLLRISLLITLVIAIIILYVVRESLSIENKRRTVTEELMMSRQKYKSLVEASTEGTLMFIDEKVIFCNYKFTNLSGFDIQDITSKKLDEIFTVSWKEINQAFSDQKKTVSIETTLMCHDNTKKNVLISVSRVKYSEKDGYIVITKEVSKQRKIERDTEKLADEVQNSLLLMNQSIKSYIDEMLTCPAESSIAQATNLMARKNKSAIFIQHNEQIIGIVTDSDLRKRVLSKSIDLSVPVTQIMSSPIVNTTEDALLYEALIQFKKHKVSHLAVLDETQEHVGFINYNHIALLQQNTVSYLIHEIEIAETIEELVTIHNKVPVLVNALIESGDKTTNITRIITSLSDAFVRRIIELGIEKFGTPPCQFAFMVTGSEGRMEQTLLTDQDNAIVLEDYPDNKKEEIEHYFKELSDFVCINLDIVGYKYCNGGMMACNPKWNQTLSVWKNYFSDWINTSDLRSIVEASIFFDFRGIYGKTSLIDDLRKHVNESIQNQPVFFHYMAQSISNYKSPVSAFGNIIGNDSASKIKTVDIKEVLSPIIKFGRLYALQQRINETNTLARLNILYQQELISHKMYVELDLSYKYLMQLRFKGQALALVKGEVPKNTIEVDNLNSIEISTLKKIFTEIGQIQSKVNHDIKS